MLANVSMCDVILPHFYEHLPLLLMCYLLSSLLTRMMAQVCGLEAGEFVHTIGECTESHVICRFIQTRLLAKDTFPLSANRRGAQASL